MLPWWRDTLTVFHRLEGKLDGRTVIIWEQEICERCFWGTTNKRISDGQNVSVIISRTVRLPPNTKGVQIGDIVVRGVIHDKIPDGESGSEILDKYGINAFIVGIAKDNTGHGLPLPHYYGGE